MSGFIFLLIREIKTMKKQTTITPTTIAMMIPVIGSIANLLSILVGLADVKGNPA